MEKRIFLVSGTGFLGSELWKNLKSKESHVCSTARKKSINHFSFDLEQSVPTQIQEVISSSHYTHGIICAAITDLEECFKNPERSERVNVAGMIELLSLFKEFSIKPIFFSSDLVFDNQGGEYLEENNPSPSTLYGRQKLKIEQWIQKEFSDFLIFRTSKQMSMQVHPRNILSQVVEAIQRGDQYRAFTDQIISPVFIEDVAEIVSQSISKNLSGIYHLAGNEQFNRFELALLVAKTCGIDSSKILPTKMASMNFSEPRGLRYTLNNKKISQALNFKFTSMEEGMKKLAEEIKK